MHSTLPQCTAARRMHTPVPATRKVLCSIIGGQWSMPQKSLTRMNDNYWNTCIRRRHQIELQWVRIPPG